jgi:hypothetical protein
VRRSGEEGQEEESASELPSGCCGVGGPGSREKGKSSADDAAGHTPMVAMKAAEKPAGVVAAETPFFRAQNCSSCTLDQLESAAYWPAQIRIAESVGKHSVAAAFFHLAFECQAQVRCHQSPKGIRAKLCKC